MARYPNRRKKYTPMSLSDAKVRNAKPRAKPYKIADGEGLFLLIMPGGSKYWRLKYSFAGKEKVLALGVYPGVNLRVARERRAQARELLAAGSDPGEAKKEAKRLVIFNSVNAFEVVAREWFEKRKHEWAPSSDRYHCLDASRKAHPAEAGPEADCRHQGAGSACHAPRR